MVAAQIDDDLSRRRERGRRSQAAFRKRQVQSVQALTDQNSRLKKGIQKLLNAARGEESPDMLSVLRDLANEAGLSFPATLSKDEALPTMELSVDEPAPVLQRHRTSDFPDPRWCIPLAMELPPTAQYRLDCGMWLDPLHYLRASLPPQDILPYLGSGADSFAGLLFWSVMEHSQCGCANHDPRAIVRTSLGHSAATQNIKPTFIQTMAKARIEYKQTGSICQEHAVASEDDLGLVLCKLVEDDYRSTGKDPNQWLSCINIEKRIKCAVGDRGLRELREIVCGKGNSAIRSLLGDLLCKLYDSSVCFGDGPRWNVDVVDTLFAPLILEAFPIRC